MIEKIILINLLILCHAFSIAQDDGDWCFENEENGIEVYTRFPEGSDIKELKIEMEVSTSLTAVVALIDDMENYSKWVYRSEGSKLIQRISATEIIYYNQIDFPWPLYDREVLMHSRLSQCPYSQIVTFQSLICDEDLVEDGDGTVRLTEYESQWLITPLESGKVHIQYQLRSDPGGHIPTWLINMAIDTGIVDTMTRFKDLLKESPYADAQLDYITER